MSVMNCITIWNCGRLNFTVGARSNNDNPGLATFVCKCTDEIDVGKVLIIEDSIKIDCRSGGG